MTLGPKVFCIGFQKTGTTSLYSALTMLGYRTAGVVGRDLSADTLRKEGADLCIRTAQDFDAAQDMPWPLFFRELDASYPGSKFILTVRDPESWFASIESHFGARPKPMQAFVYGDNAAAPAGNHDNYIKRYTDHNENVRAYFADRPTDFLEMDLGGSDGWEVLCPFLGLPAPQSPFPVKNTSAARKSLAYRVKRHLWRLAGMTPSPERMI